MAIAFLTVCAVMSGYNDWDEIEEYGKEKEAWLKKHIGLPKGIHWDNKAGSWEDLSTKKAGNAAENFSMICKASLSILKKEGTKNRSFKRKMQKAGWNNEYLESLVFS